MQVTTDEEQKAWKREYMRNYRKAHLERERDRTRKWRKDNPEKLRASVRKWYEANPEKVRNGEYKRKYGITLKQYNAMFAAQGKRCAICRTDNPNKKRGWHVDHDHETNEVRSILCSHCNTMVGLSREKPAILRAAADYLEHHRKVTPQVTSQDILPMATDGYCEHDEHEEPNKRSPVVAPINDEPQQDTNCTYDQDRPQHSAP